MSTESRSAIAGADIPSRRNLFLGFMVVGVQGFGGVMPFARRMLVEQRRWLTEREFTEVLSLAQFLPGPNIVNVSIIVGSRYGGPLGAVAAASGLMLMPFLIVLALAVLYARFSAIDAVRRATYGLSAAASGLIIAMGLKMALPLRAVVWQVVMALLALLAIGVLRLPLLWVLAVLAPLSIGIAWWRRQ